MNYYGPKELSAAYRTVRNNTITVAQDIPEEKYNFQATPECRTVAQTLLHVIAAPRLANWLGSLSDDFLAESVAFPAGMQPPTKTRFEMLLGLKEHEMHHRGQLMMIERMVGVVPHLTRQMQERIAAMQAQANSKAGA